MIFTHCIIFCHIDTPFSIVRCFGLFPIVEIKEDHPNENEQAVYSELAIARKSATIACIWQRLKGRQAGRGVDRLY